MRHLILIALLVNSAATANASLKAETEEQIRSQFEYEVFLHFSPFTVPPEQKETIERSCGQQFMGDAVYVWRITKGDSCAGFAVLDNVPGKAMPITFLVLFDNSGRIVKASVVKYRESIGGSVANRRWLDQFEGLNESSNFDVGHNIDAITGATISVYSVTRGIRKLAKLLPQIRRHYTDKAN